MPPRRKLPVPAHYIATHSNAFGQIQQPVDAFYNYCAQQLDTSIPIQLLSDEQARCYIPQQPETARLYQFYREREELLPIFAVVNVLLDVELGPLEEQHWLICDRCGAAAGLDELLTKHTCQEDTEGHENSKTERV